MFRTVTTERSIWKFDLDRLEYCRIPATEVDEHPSIPYTNEWEPYEEIIECPMDPKGRSLIVVRPVPMGTGRLRQTGYIIEDVTTDA